MRIFVTGATGFVGSHFVKIATSRGYQVIAHRRQFGGQCRIPITTEPKWLTKELSKVTAADLNAVDCIVHLSAAGVTERTSWSELLISNVIEPVNLWNTAANAGVTSYVICGSCFEYGRSSERYDFVPVDAPLEPVTPYGVSKASASLAAIAFAAETGARVSICRPFHVYGEGEAENRLWPSLRRAALDGSDYLLTPGEQLRDFVPVELVAEKLLEASANIETVPGLASIYNIGTGTPQSIKSFAEYWWAQWKAKGRLRVGAIQYRENEVMRYVPEVNMN